MPFIMGTKNYAVAAKSSLNAGQGCPKGGGRAQNRLFLARYPPDIILILYQI